MEHKPASRLKADAPRIAILLVLVGILLYVMDPANLVVFQALGIAMFLVGGSHLTRRILFPRLDLQQVAKNAVQERNMAAAVVFASICAVILGVTHLSLSVLK